MQRVLTIQQWSTLLVLVCILPPAIASSFLIWHAYQRERAIVERTTVQTARALMQVVDRELASAKGTLVALAASPSLAAGDLAAFHRQARDVLRHRPDNIIVLSDAAGAELVNSALPYGALPRERASPAQTRRVFAEARPLVSDLYREAASQRSWLSVDVPVSRGKVVLYDLSMQFPTSYLSEILERQHIAAGHLTSIYDSTGVIAARNRAAERYVGQRGAPALVQRISEIAEGTIQTESLEGTPIMAAFSRSALSGWSVAIGIPLTEFQAGLWHSVSLVILGTVLLLLTVLILARAAATHIARAIRSLAAPALALGQGGPAEVRATGLREADDVGQALLKASALLRERTLERDEAERAERELRLVKQQLEQSEAMQRGIFEQGPDAILLVGPSGQVLRASQEAARVFGHPHPHLMRLTVEDLMPAAFRARHAALRAQFGAAPRRRPMGTGGTLLGLRADGTEFPIDVMLSPLQSAGQDLVIATVRDVTERLRAENALRESEKRFRSTLEHAPIGMAIVALDGRWLEVNTALCDILGYSKGELETLAEPDITHPDDLAESAARSAQLTAGTIRSYQMEKRYTRKDGRPVPVMLTVSLVRDADGVPVHFVEQVENITARKRDEEQLRTLSNRLTLATEAGGIGVWEQDLVTHAIWCDKRMHALYRLGPGAGDADGDNWWRRIDPGHVERIGREFAAAIDSKGLFATEYPICLPGNGTRIVRTHAVLSLDAQGRPARMTGISWDVTESRQKEAAISAALSEKETLLKELYHRVKNNLQVITSLFHLQARTLSDGQARAALTEGAGRVRAMALVHEKLYQSRNLSSILLDDYVAELCQQLGNASSAEQRAIRFRYQTEPIQAGLETAIPLGLVLNELISNSLSHAFPDGAPGTITVSLRRQDAQLVELVVADSGVGFPPNFDATSCRSLGLKLVAALSGQIDGKLALQNCAGARVTILFPLKADGQAGSAHAPRLHHDVPAVPAHD